MLNDSVSTKLNPLAVKLMNILYASLLRLNPLAVKLMNILYASLLRCCSLAKSTLKYYNNDQ